MTVLGGIVASVFGVLGLLHVFWGAGGRLGTNAVVPTVAGKKAFEPSRFATFAVAAALFLAAATVVLHLRPGLWVLSAVFAARAFGDLKSVGFTKRVRGTPFARWDTWLFSPLCTFVAIACFVEAGVSAGPS